jgi:hypothetical protein
MRAALRSQARRAANAAARGNARSRPAPSRIIALLVIVVAATALTGAGLAAPPAADGAVTRAAPGGPFRGHSANPVTAAPNSAPSRSYWGGYEAIDPQKSPAPAKPPPGDAIEAIDGTFRVPYVDCDGHAQAYSHIFVALGPDTKYDEQRLDAGVSWECSPGTTVPTYYLYYDDTHGVNPTFITGFSPQAGDIITVLIQAEALSHNGEIDVWEPNGSGFLYQWMGDLVDQTGTIFNSAGCGVYRDGVAWPKFTNVDFLPEPTETVYPIVRPACEVWHYNDIRAPGSGPPASGGTPVPVNARGSDGAVTVQAGPVDAGGFSVLWHPVACDPSSTTVGAPLADLFPGSKDIGTLAQPFQNHVRAFVAAMKAAGIHVGIATTFRPVQRAYMMHWTWLISKENFSAEDVPPFSQDGEEPVDVCWVIRDSNGIPDQKESREAADAAFKAFEIDPENKVPPALLTRHATGQAIDMTTTWTSPTITILNAAKHPVLISSQPQNGLNAALEAIGAGYKVMHYMPAAADKNHWSDNGK